MNVTNTVLFGSFLNIFEPSIHLRSWCWARFLVRQRPLMKNLKQNRCIIATIINPLSFLFNYKYFSTGYQSRRSGCGWILLRVCRSFPSVYTMGFVQQSLPQLTNYSHIISQLSLALKKVGFYLQNCSRMCGIWCFLFLYLERLFVHLFT